MAQSHVQQGMNIATVIGKDLVKYVFATTHLSVWNICHTKGCYVLFLNQLLGFSFSIMQSHLQCIDSHPTRDLVENPLLTPRVCVKHGVKAGEGGSPTAYN